MNANCPYCAVRFSAHEFVLRVGDDRSRSVCIVTVNCSGCDRLILYATSDAVSAGNGYHLTASSRLTLVYPPGPAVPVLPREVPAPFAAEYVEACQVVEYSPKASAALCRRCLQSLLVEQGGARESRLVEQIAYVVPLLPPHLGRDLDAIRNIGNFAAHPIKSVETGAIADVEPGEAHWCLAVLKGLLEHYFVGPAQSAVRRTALNEKLKEHGKPEMQ